MLSVLLAVGGAQALGNKAQGGNGPEPLRVLFVGNSLTATNDLLPAVVAALAKTFELTPRSRTARSAPGGVNLEDHWVAGTAGAELDTGEWDAVVMQQGPSSLPESQVDLRKWAVRFADRARAHQVRPALLTVWPRRNARMPFRPSSGRTGTRRGRRVPSSIPPVAPGRPPGGEIRGCRCTAPMASTRASSART